jgi:hypothetical protein
MRKQDIKPGVVYAYQQSRAYGAPEPIVFLTAPADGPLYIRRSRHDHGDGKPRYVRAAEYDKVSTGRGSLLARTVGYPVAHLDSSDRKPDDLLNATLAGFEATTGTSEDEFVYRLETRLACIIGPWNEVGAQHEAQKRAERERRERQQQAEQVSRNRAAAVAGVLSSAGIVAESAHRHGAVTHIRLSLDEAEKLARLLNPEAGE